MAGFKNPPPFAKGAKKQEEKVEQVNQEEISENPLTETVTDEKTKDTKGEVMSEEKPKRERSKVNISQEHIKFVRQNVKKMGYTEMAEQLGITRNQINRILQTLKEGMRGAAVQADPNAYGTKENKKGETVYDWSQPKSDMAKKVEAKIESDLSRPAESRPGAGGSGGGKVQQALDSELEDLLKDL